jgi:tRNA-Thr(GGU) m(6)t(6)A37 methyltransferase TsaA
MGEWIYFLHTPRDDFAATMTEPEGEAWGRHFTRLKELAAAGSLILAGPTLGRINTGIAVFDAPDEDAAREIMDADPAITGGFARGELRAFRVSLLRGRPEPGDAPQFTVTPVATVIGGRTEPIDDDWDHVEATIGLADRFPTEAIAGLDSFSHLDVVYVFDRVAETSVVAGARHPRSRPDWPAVGIFAQRAKARPNRIGVSTCRLLGVDGRRLRVRGLDAIDGTPVLDLKPHVTEMGPREPVTEPAWMSELMAGYWDAPPGPGR